MLFKEIIGLETIKDDLRRMVQVDRIPHALLLLGPPGSGKLGLAIAFARYVLCEDRQENDACGRCPSCLKAARLIHPDLHFSFPTIGTNVTSDAFLGQWRTAVLEHPYFDLNDWLQSIGAENRQGNINKEECMNIIRKLSLKTFEGSFKVMIMWRPELLGKEGNRLLKLIEEPPERTLFMLVAEDQEQILNTILSRCQLLKVRGLSDVEVEKGLLNDFPDIGERATTIAYLAEGDYNVARKLALQKENNNSKLFLGWLRKCYRGNGVEIVGFVEKLAGLGRENQKFFLQYALHFLREYLMLKVAGQPRIRLLEEEQATARNLTKVLEFDQVELLVQLLSDCAYHVERNANPKILFLDVSVQMNKILKRTRPELAGS